MKGQARPAWRQGSTIEIVKTVFIVVAVTVVTTLLLRAAQRPAAFDQEAGCHVLRYSGSVRSTVWLSVIASIGVVVLAIISEPQTRGDWIAVVGMVAGFAGLGGVLANECRARVRLSLRGIDAVSPWRGNIEIPWSNVRAVSYSKLAQWFVVRSDSGQVIRVHNYMTGVETLLDYFHEQLEPGLFSKAEKEYRAVTGGVL